MSWLQTGAQSQQLAQQEAAEVQKRQEEGGKMFRFFIKNGEEARITFIDGAPNAQGHLTPPRFYEHSIQQQGKWTTFVCPEKTNPASGDKCPICAGGDRPALISLFTIIDHRTVSSKDGQKTYSDTVKLLAMKPKAFELLMLKVKKLGSLVGCTFDFTRIGENSSSVGDVFDFVERRDPHMLMQMYQKEVKDEKGKAVGMTTKFTPANYETEIVFRTGAELSALGFGTVQQASQPYQPQQGYQPQAAASVNMQGYVPPSQQSYGDQSGGAPDFSKEL